MAIFHSHGHIDHFGCTQRFQELSGAKTYISRIDNDIVNGRYDLSWAKELAYERLPFDLVMGNHPPQNDTEGKLKKTAFWTRWYSRSVRMEKVFDSERTNVG